MVASTDRNLCPPATLKLWSSDQLLNTLYQSASYPRTVEVYSGLAEKDIYHTAIEAACLKTPQNTQLI